MGALSDYIDKHSLVITEATDQQLIDLLRFIKDQYPIDEDFAAELAVTLANSGAYLHDLPADSMDIASTGGPSSLSTLLPPLFLMKYNSIIKLGVPGRPAGGIDTLAQIKGYKYQFDQNEIMGVVDKCGYAHFLPSSSFTPLDLRLYHLRVATETLSIPTLVAASLLSKKLAAGLHRIGLDVRVHEKGNFGTTWEESLNYAKFFNRVAARINITSTCVLTNGFTPYQPYIGRGESLIALNDIFRGDMSCWLRAHLDLCRQISIVCAEGKNRDKISKTTTSELRDNFSSNLDAQGTSFTAYTEQVERLHSEHVHYLYAKFDGFVCIDLYSIRDTIVKNNASDQGFSDNCGLILYRNHGDWVNSGDRMASVRVSPVLPVQQVLRSFENAISQTRVLPKTLVAEGVYNG